MCFYITGCLPTYREFHWLASCVLKLSPVSAASVIRIKRTSEWRCTCTPTCSWQSASFVCANTQVFGTASIVVSVFAVCVTFPVPHNFLSGVLLVLVCSLPGDSYTSEAPYRITTMSFLIYFPVVRSERLQEMQVLTTSPSSDIFLLDWRCIAHHTLVAYTQIPSQLAKLYQVRNAYAIQCLIVHFLSLIVFRKYINMNDQDHRLFYGQSYVCRVGYPTACKCFQFCSLGYLGIYFPICHPTTALPFLGKIQL